MGKTDDLLKASPQLVPRRPAIGRAPQLADAELVTLAMTQAMPGFPAEGKPSSALNHLLIVSE
ncbi:MULTISPECIES: hypothetical protein [Streptomyces]|uniref:hypothetical protein n=1 Tax=unclassified Streptomyces TaxID=2593676 RepID=UPI00278139D3|nr:MULTISPECIES: hypothetical protein [unclassified Streptomyces]MDQ0700359.1 hypothetical protein [Streptomyces sp. W4I9-2]MDX3489540.1 hypothetical protein [Streptomyces sp. ID05-18]